MYDAAGDGFTAAHQVSFDLFAGLKHESQRRSAWNDADDGCGAETFARGLNSVKVQSQVVDFEGTARVGLHLFRFRAPWADDTDRGVGHGLSVGLHHVTVNDAARFIQRRSEERRVGKG